MGLEQKAKDRLQSSVFLICNEIFQAGILENQERSVSNSTTWMYRPYFNHKYT